MTWFSELPDRIKAIVAAVSALGLSFAGGGAVFLALFAGSIPERLEAHEQTAAEHRVQLREHEAAIATLQRQRTADRIEIEFLSCAEVARQQGRDDPSCLNTYFRARGMIP